MAEQAALRRIERPVPDVPHVDLPQHRIGLAHPLQDGDGPDPERHGQAIPHRVARLNARLTETRIVNKDQFAIAAENLVRAVR